MALTSVVAAVVLTGTKLVVGVATGSLGLLSEAAHSALDLVAAVITWLAVRVADRPADEQHHYGHGKIESLSALAETLLLLVTCVWIVWEAARRLLFVRVEVEATAWSFAVIIMSIIIDVSRSRALLRVAKKHGSQALEADALHFSTDVWSSTVVLFGLGLVYWGQQTGRGLLCQRADAIAALVVAMIVVHVSLTLGRKTIDVLLDRAPEGLADHLRKLVRRVEGVVEIAWLRVRPLGHGVFVDLGVGVGRRQSFEQGHAVASAVEQAIRAELPDADIVVHAEPVALSGMSLPDCIRAVAADQGQHVHSVEVLHDEDGAQHVALHVELPPTTRLGIAHELATQLECAIRDERPDLASVTTHLEAQIRRAGEARTVSANTEELESIVARVAEETGVIRQVHRIAFRQSGTRLSLTLHVVADADLTVTDVHRVVSDFEARLRASIAGLSRITTHAEPG